MKYFILFAIFIVGFFILAGFANAIYYDPYYPSPACTPRAFSDCYGGSVYWFNSCGQVQDLYQNCYEMNMICQYGQCVYQQYFPSTPNLNPYNPYATTACYGNSIYWYDNLGVSTGLYKSCVDANSCTQDSCFGGRCSNVLKCDGSTCSVDSTDYNTFCKAELKTTALKREENITGLSVSFFSKQDLNSTQWQKSVQVGQNSQVYFLVSIANNSKNSIDNVIVSANIPSEVALLGNIQVDNVPLTGDIIAGVNIGALAPMSAKVVNFEGKTQSFSEETTKEARVKAVAGQISQSDTLSINFMPGQVAGVSTSSNSFIDFIKRWYLWILVGAVLVFLFFVVFRRLSLNA